jgi:hypothetical protein
MSVYRKQTDSTILLLGEAETFIPVDLGDHDLTITTTLPVGDKSYCSALSRLERYYLGTTLTKEKHKPTSVVMNGNKLYTMQTGVVNVKVQNISLCNNYFTSSSASFKNCSRRVEPAGWIQERPEDTYG